MTRQEMIAELERVSRIAEAIQRLKAMAGEAEVWPGEIAPRIDADGATFFGMGPLPYDEGDAIAEETVTWDEIDTADFATLEQRVADAKRNAAELQQAVRRQQYETLKREFGR